MAGCSVVHMHPQGFFSFVYYSVPIFLASGAPMGGSTKSMIDTYIINVNIFLGIVPTPFEHEILSSNVAGNICMYVGHWRTSRCFCAEN